MNVYAEKKQKTTLLIQPHFSFRKKRRTDNGLDTPRWYLHLKNLETYSKPNLIYMCWQLFRLWYQQVVCTCSYTHIICCVYQWEVHFFLKELSYPLWIICRYGIFKFKILLFLLQTDYTLSWADSNGMSSLIYCLSTPEVEGDTK